MVSLAALANVTITENYAYCPANMHVPILWKSKAFHCENGLQLESLQANKEVKTQSRTSGSILRM